VGIPMQYFSGMAKNKKSLHYVKQMRRVGGGELDVDINVLVTQTEVLRIAVQNPNT
jgi:hypothetical protein